MRLTILFCGGMLILAGLTACKEKPEEVEISETRDLTTGDRRTKLNATHGERFGEDEGAGGSQSGGFRYTLPEGWKEQPLKPMRSLNFAAGKNSEVEIYLSEVGGSLPENITRWYGQFAATPPTAEELAKLPLLPFLGQQGVLVEVSGTYSHGFGRSPAPGSALAALIVAANGGVVTVKMVGPEAVVKAELEHFKAFCVSLTRGE